MKISCYLLMGVVLLAGCQSSGEPQPSESCPGYAEAGSTKALAARKVSYIDRPDVRVVEMRCVSRADLLRIDIDLKNRRSKEQHIAYRFDWFEANGMSTGSEEAWKPLVLYPGVPRTIRTVSPSTDAKDFRLLIKR
ncbi:MAG: YcfL family protein [Betaproteobacteria bacterium]|nr:MAG: YcfL family protein [Betaproteobacteria bacterium]